MMRTPRDRSMNAAFNEFKKLTYEKGDSDWEQIDASSERKRCKFRTPAFLPLISVHCNDVILRQRQNSAFLCFRQRNLNQKFQFDSDKPDRGAIDATKKELLIASGADLPDSYVLKQLKPLNKEIELIVFILMEDLKVRVLEISYDSIHALDIQYPVQKDGMFTIESDHVVCLEYENSESAYQHYFRDRVASKQSTFDANIRGNLPANEEQESPLSTLYLPQVDSDMGFKFLHTSKLSTLYWNILATAFTPRIGCGPAAPGSTLTSSRSNCWLSIAASLILIVLMSNFKTLPLRISCAGLASCLIVLIFTVLMAISSRKQDQFTVVLKFDDPCFQLALQQAQKSSSKFHYLCRQGLPGWAVWLPLNGWPYARWMRSVVSAVDSSLKMLDYFFIALSLLHKATEVEHIRNWQYYDLLASLSWLHISFRGLKKVKDKLASLREFCDRKLQLK
jgi:hypothetical protein